MEPIKFSMYNTVLSKEKIDITHEDYCSMITEGKYQDAVLMARAIKKDKEQYKSYKSKMPCITGSAVMNVGDKTKENISQLNGLLVIDIDDFVPLDTLVKLGNDPYTFIIHRSFGGDGVCIFVKINPNKFLESFIDLGQYYWDNYSLAIDPSCKNPNRLRYLSYDPDLVIQEKSKKYVSKTRLKVEKKKEQYVFVQNDFSDLVERVQEIDLCNNDYKRYCDIGFAIGSEYGINGLDYFKAICQSGAKYDPKAIEKHYSHFCNKGSITISTFYHYVKEAGIEIYSENTKSIIKAVAVQKAQGKATVESVKTHLKAQKIEVNELLIRDLLNSDVDYKFDDGQSKMAKLESFVIDNYSPERNLITSEIKINNTVIDDRKLNSIYLTASKLFDFPVHKGDISSIINSDATTDINPLNDFFKIKDFTVGTIDSYIDCVQPQSDYNRWAFKKWIVGNIHNWMSALDEARVSPLTFVLCGQKQGTGKTSFFRNILPTELQDYLIEKKIDANDKDSMYNLAKGLICFDDEFGGLATKDVKDFKRVADTNWIDIRLPYSAVYTKIKRRASLAGTTNEATILKDVTGNRRLLPCNVESIDYNKMMSIDTADLWREAYDLWKSGFDWKIYSPEDLAFLNGKTVENLDVSPVEEIFFNFFSIEKTDVMSKRVIYNQGDVLNYLNANTSINISKFEVKDIFIRNKFEYKAHRILKELKKGVIFYTHRDFGDFGSDD